MPQAKEDLRGPSERPQRASEGKEDRRTHRRTHQPTDTPTYPRTHINHLLWVLKIFLHCKCSISPTFFESVMDGRTDGPTNRWTDTPSYRDARTHLTRTHLKKRIKMDRKGLLTLPVQQWFAVVWFDFRWVCFAFSFLPSRFYGASGLSFDFPHWAKSICQFVYSFMSLKNE